MKREVKSDEIRLEGQTAVWDMLETAEVEGTYQGEFKFRTALNPLQEITADREYRDLMGSNEAQAPTRIKNLAYALTQLKYRVLEAPHFWVDGSHLPGSQVKDIEIIELVFQAAMLSETKYKALIAERQLEAIEKLKASRLQQQAKAKDENELKSLG